MIAGNLSETSQADISGDGMINIVDIIEPINIILESY